MSGKNWRNLHWRDMEKTRKLWFALMCIMLGILFIALILECTNIVDIPNWVALVWVVVAGYTANKNIIGNGLWRDADQNDDIDSNEFDE